MDKSCENCMHSDWVKEELFYCENLDSVDGLKEVMAHHVCKEWSEGIGYEPHI